MRSNPKETSPSQFRSVVGALLLTCCALIVSAGVAEGVTRVYARSGDSAAARLLSSDPLAILVEPYGELGYRQGPNRTIRYANGQVATSNSMSFRGPEVSLTKPEGTTRIVLLGGSTTHGWGVDDHSTIDEFMRQLLAEQYPGRSFEVINLGYDGYDSYQIYERLKGDGMPLQPDVVIVNTGINDVRSAHYPDLKDRDPRTMLWLAELQRSREDRLRGGPTLWTRVKHYSYFARWPGALRTRVSRTRLSKSQESLERPYPDALYYFERNLGRIAGLTSNTPTILLFSIEPSSLPSKYAPDATSTITYWIVDAATTQEYRDSLDERLQSFVEEAGKSGERIARIPYTDIPPDLFLDDAHLTPEGNRRLAEVFVTALYPVLGSPAGHSIVVPSHATRLDLLRESVSRP